MPDPTIEQVLAAAKERWHVTEGLLEWNAAEITLRLWTAEQSLPVFEASAPKLAALLEKMEGDPNAR